MTKIDALNAVVSKALSGFAPPENLTVSQWAEKHRRLSPETSAEAAPWRTSRTPYLRKPMDCFSDPKVRRIAMVAASQVGKSEFINNCIGYIIDQDPGGILFIQPTTVDAKEYSKLRISPMIRDSETLRRKVKDAKSRDSGNTILQKSFPGGMLTMCGSTEAHALCSKPTRYVFGDERDRWATSAGNEGDPWSLARARQITFYNAKSVEVSTPTIKGASAIEDSFYAGTMERWHTLCPHCGEYHEITFSSIRYEHEEIVTKGKKTFRVNSVWYVCPECGAISDEFTMKHQPSKWVAENPSAYDNTGTVSFWLNAFTSAWASWESIILDYLQAIGNTEKLKVVYNTRLGELWEDRGGLEDEDTYMARREEYPAELPDGVLALTCGVDTQDDRLEYEVVGYGFFGEDWGIKKGIIMGSPGDDSTWAKLDDVIDHVYRFENGKGLRPSITFVDEGGHFTQEVRNQCRARLSKQVYAIKGRGGEGIPFTSPPRKVKIVIKGKYIGTCWQYLLGVDSGKQLIMDKLRVQTPGSKYSHFPRNEEAGYGSKYFQGLLSEHLVYKAGRRNPWAWEKIPGHERNEPLDCRNYANAACRALSPDMDALFRRLKGTQDTKPKTPPVAVATPRKAPQKRSLMSKYMDEW